MTWLLTATGAVVNLRFIRDDDISVLDIAHHLAQTNRYTGACSRPYSVAEHSLLVCEIVERAHGERNPSMLLAALMHDAHEAYTQDLSGPMKELIGEAWAAEESRIAHSVRARFRLLTAFAAARKQIAHADRTALATEREQLMPPGGPAWTVTASHPPIGWWNFAEREAFTWLDWRQAFLDRFAELNFARGLHAESILTPSTDEKTP